MPARTQTLVQLNDKLVAQLDRRAAARGMSRSALVRELLSAALEEEHADALSQRMVDGYRAVPQQEGEDAWGDLDAWTERNTRRNRAALDGEESDRF